MWKKHSMVWLLAVALLAGFGMVASDAIAADKGDTADRQKDEAPIMIYFGEALPEFMDAAAGTCSFTCGGTSHSVPAVSEGDCACICANTCNATCTSGRFTCSVSQQ